MPQSKYEIIHAIEYDCNLKLYTPIGRYALVGLTAKEFAESGYDDIDDIDPLLMHKPKLKNKPDYVYAIKSKNVIVFLYYER